MAEGDVGIVFTQSGVPVRNSADYQRVYDSRWKFMEIEFEVEVDFNIPASPATEDVHYERIPIFRHCLGFLPLFESNYTPPNQPGYSRIFADKDTIFLRVQQSLSGVEALSGKVKLRIYNLPITQEYEAPKGPPLGTTSARSDMGVRFIDDNARSVSLASRSPTGFSVDSKKKILSIHKHGVVKINDFEGVGNGCAATAINTSTDTLTIGPKSFELLPSDLSWFTKVGTPINYYPSDGSTFPGGISSSDVVYYVIPVDSTHIKLASSRHNAISGIAIDITSAGSLPANISIVPDPNIETGVIEHNVGYPPTYIWTSLEADSPRLSTVDPEDLYIGGIDLSSSVLATADNRYIRFAGFQGVDAIWMAYVILKDPAEIAR